MSVDSRSRVENILNVILDQIDPSVLEPAQSRVEALLLLLEGKIEDLADLAGKLPIHICIDGEYNPLTGMPTISNPKVDIFYLVPSGSGTNVYDEWVYSGTGWEQFGGGGTGILPNFSIGTVTTLPEGSQATVTLTGTMQDPVLNFGIPEGAAGDEYTVLIQSQQPSQTSNKLWINPGESDEVEVPDYEEFQEVVQDVTELKSQMTDIAGTNVVITPTWITGKRIIENGSEVASGTAFAVTDYIAVMDTEQMIVSGVNASTAFTMPTVHYYDASKNHVGFAYAYGTYSIKDDVTAYNVAYIRLSSYDNGTHPFSAIFVNYSTPGEVDENRSDIDALLETAVIVQNRHPQNMLDGIALYDNMRWMANSPEDVVADGFTLTDFIEVDPEKLYAFITRTQLITQPGGVGLSVYYAQFDESKAIILQDNNGYADRIRPGATTKYIKISFQTSRLQENPVFAEAPFTGNIASPKTEILGVYKSVSPAEIMFKGANSQYNNLLYTHRGSLADGKYLANGLISNNANWIALIDYIPCAANTSYNGAITTQLTYNPTFKVSWYDANGNYLSEDLHANNTPFVSPENAAFFRIAIVKGNVTTFDDVFFAATDAPYGPPCIDPSPVFTDIYPATSLYGKTWAAFGDSITEKNVRATINYHDFIRAETGITVINKGLGGSGYKCRWQNDNNIPALADAFDFTGVDIVTCMAGINDAWSDLTSNMGEPDDVYDTSATAQNQSVMACFNHFLDIVIEKAPLAKIGIISPIPCYHTQSGTLYDFNPANDNSTLAQFVEKCKVSCEHHGIPYLDLFHNSGLRPWDSTVNAAMFKCNASDSPDGLHPNHLGHKYFYPLVREFVRQLG